jgi:hypothetical protein
MKTKTNRLIILLLGIFWANILYASGPAHVVVPPGTCTLNGTSAPYNALHGGDTLLMTSGNKAYIYLLNFTGSSTAPIVVINQGGTVTIGTNYTYGVKIGGCRYIKLTGTGTSDPYGFQVTQTNGDGISIGDLSSDIEVNHVRISNCGIRGIVAKTDPACGGYANRSNFTQYNTILHDNLIENTTTEGMYIGSSFYSGETFNCSGVDSTLYPSILNGCQIYNNIVRHTGYDGIQAASALNLSVHHNLVQYDSQSGVSSQMSGILIGGGSQGDCYDNYIEYGNGDGIENLGLGGYKIYNNVIVNPGQTFYPGNQSYPKFGIYTNDCSAIQGSEFDLMFNTIISPKTTGIKFASVNATASVIENNAIISPGQAGSYIVNNGYSGITIRNNYTSATIAPAMFTDTTYKTNPGSPLIDAGYPETKGITTDKFGNARSQGSAPDIGVYESPGGSSIPTLTTAAVTTITQTTATSGGNITSDGGAAVTARGVCWGTATCPVITGNHTSDGTGTGTFVSYITGLSAGTLYYVRSYATNSAGTAYGNELTFTTLTLPTVTTAAVTNIAQTTATSGGNVTATGGAGVTARGVCWSTTSSPTINGSHTNDGTGTGTFVSNITALTAGTLYYVRAYATNSAGTAYGNQLSFTTLPIINPPTVTTTAVTNIAQTTATSGGNITSDGGAAVTARGVCWATATCPVITGNHTNDGTGTGSFISSITGLTAATLYYVRAYATNSAGTAYGNELTFTTLPIINPPTVTTAAVTNIAQTTATSGGNITSDGGAAVTARGVCWGTATCPVITGNHTNDGTGTGSFISSITGLTAATLYYVRAYATNSAGTAYGNELTFTTLPIINLPTVTTAAVTNIAQTTATSGGNVTATGGAAVTARGVCWSTSSSPTINGSHTNDGTGTGTFVSNISGLTANTIYYVRAYATNSAGTTYGNELSFTTLPNIYPPTVTTAAVTNITQTTATSGGNVTATGGASVTARGVCWSTSSSPTINGSHTNDGTGTGIFVSNITGLTASTVYYVRAYATNSAGTSYGTEQNFRTLAPTTLATVTTKPVTNIHSNSATCGGTVTSDGGAAVTARGVCWNTSGNPVKSNAHTQDGTGTGSFTSSITGLKSHTHYYVRAYATNSNGTSYGNQVSFTTLRSSRQEEVYADTVSSVTETDVQTGIPKLEFTTLSLYPNPCRSSLTIAFDLPENSNVNIAVYNLSGIKIYNEQLNDQLSGAHEKQLNTAAYSDGLYIVILTTDKSAIRKRFIKID